MSAALPNPVEAGARLRAVADPFGADRLVGRSAQGVATALVQTGGKAVFGLLMPLLLAPTAYGNYAYLIWLTTVVIQMGSLGVPQAAQRFLPSSVAEARPGIARLLARVPFLSGAAGTLVVALWFVLAPGAGINLGSMALAALLVVPGECVLIWAALLRGSLRFDAIMAGEMTGLVTKCVLLAAILLAGHGLTLVEVLGAEAAAILLQAGWLWRANRQLCRRPGEAVAAELRRSMMSYALGVWSLLLIDSLLWRVEIAFLHSFVSAQAAAIFSATAQVTQAAILLPCAAITALFPSFAALNARTDGAAGALYRQTNALVWSATLPFYFLATAAGSALLLAYGARYQETLTLLPLVMVSRTLVVAACASSTWLCAIGEQNRLLRIVAIGAVLNLAGNAYLVPRFGLWGAVAGACLFQPAVSIATIWRAWRHSRCGFPLGWPTAAATVAAVYLGGLFFIERRWLAAALVFAAGCALLAADGQVRRSWQSAGQLIRAASGL